MTPTRPDPRPAASAAARDGLTELLTAVPATDPADDLAAALDRATDDGLWVPRQVTAGRTPRSHGFIARRPRPALCCVFSTPGVPRGRFSA